MLNMLTLLKSIEKDEKIKIVTAICVVLATIGFKYVANDFEEHCNHHFNTRLMKSLAVFSLIFINTKNIIISVFFTLVYNTVHFILIGNKGKCEKKLNI